MNTFYGHTGRVNKSNFTPNGKRICSIGEDCTLKVWSIT